MFRVTIERNAEGVAEGPEDSGWRGQVARADFATTNLITVLRRLMEAVVIVGLDNDLFDQYARAVLGSFDVGASAA